MFHARFIVHQNVAVVIGKLVHGHGKVLVGSAVAARAIRPSHYHQVKTL